MVQDNITTIRKAILEPSFPSLQTSWPIKKNVVSSIKKNLATRTNEMFYNVGIVIMFVVLFSFSQEGSGFLWPVVTAF